MGYLSNDSDLQQYQGAEYDVIFIDEATNITEFQFKSVVACMRGVNNFPKRTYLTCNPGGVGHQYVKRLFVDRKYNIGEKPEDYSFIQSLVDDNKVLMESQPEYKAQLEQLPERLKKAWLYGDWNIFEGQFFDEFRDEPTHYQDRLNTHVIDPFDIPITWKIFRSYDFGYSKPFSCAWWAVDYDGRMYRILELYGCTKEPNEGVKWTADKQFQDIKRIENEHPWLQGREIRGVADPAIWETSHGESVAETAMKCGVYFEKGDHKRIAGWMQCRQRFQFDEEGKPMVYIFKTCKAFIRTIPLLIYSETHCEDLDTTMEDHCLRGDTQVLTSDGYKSIESMVGTSGMVMSSDGKYHKYSDVRMTRRKAKIFCMELEDGTKVYCTEDHRFMLPNGEFAMLKDLSVGKELKVKTIKHTEIIKQITLVGESDVYNMEVEDTHDFVIQGGVISHNCADEFRYACMSRPIKPKRNTKSDIYIGDDPLNLYGGNMYG